VAFWVWAGLYFTTPAVVLLVWLRNRRVGAAKTSTGMMPRLLRLLLAVTGGGLVLVSLALFVSPTTMADLWVWRLSPLTARTMAAAFLLPAVLNFGVALDGRWRTARIPFEAQVVALALVLLSTARGRDDFDGADAEVAGFVAGLLVLLAVSSAIYAYAARRATDDV
jgi:hypothetical protein